MSENIKLDNHYIGQKEPALIVAEIGLNHNGDVQLGKEMIKAAAESGADAVKFQTFNTQKFLSSNSFDIAERERYELSLADHQQLLEAAYESGVEFFSTPLDNSSVDLLEELRVNLFKVASSDLTNTPLLRRIAKSRKPVIISTGYSRIDEIFKAHYFLLEAGTPAVIIMHCVASYPTSDTDVNLANISMLGRMFPGSVIGFSDHSLDYELLPPVAVALGARVIEKHFTTDQNLPGYDHQISLTPEMLNNMTTNIRRVESLMGRSRVETGVILSEYTRREKARRSLYWARDAQKGEVIKEEHIIPKRPGLGLSPEFLDQILGLELQQDVIDDTLVELKQVG